MKKDERINIRASAEKKADYVKRAKSMGMKLTEWIDYKIDQPDFKEWKAKPDTRPRIGHAGVYKEAEKKPVIKPPKAKEKKATVEMNGRKPFICRLKNV